MYKILFAIFSLLSILNANTNFRQDDSTSKLAKPLHPKSHIKIFLPSIPYSYIAKSINSGLIRSADNAQGWEYDLAISHKRLDEYTYIFKIRKNLKFQDGTPCKIDNIIRNLENFRKYPILYTNIDKVDFDIKKVDDSTIKLTLHKKYEMFLYDLARVYFYTDEYLEKYTPKGEHTGSANKIPGAYGMGPYILESGYAVGQKQTDKLELVANPYYWDKRYPKIKRITVYTQLNMNEALEKIVNKEGQLDISPIPFNKKIEVVMSKYSKLIIKKSTNNFINYFNLINGNKKLKDKKVRIALNQALNQENLLNFVYKKEGEISPYSTSINYDIVRKIANKKSYSKDKLTEQEKKNLLDGLVLNIFTQDRFMFLWKGIEYQLKKYGVKLNYTITSSEKDIYKQLLNTRNSQNTQKWDILTWGDDDWYYLNPWTVFFIYELGSPWCMIDEDKLMQKYIQEYFQTNIRSKEYEKIVEKILNRARDMAYTLRVPSHNKVIAVNKEVFYQPYKGGIIPLWKIEITKDHWSIRNNKKYEKKLQIPVKIQRLKDENN